MVLIVPLAAFRWQPADWIDLTRVDTYKEGGLRGSGHLTPCLC